MNKPQWLLAGFGTLLFVALYFGFETKNKAQKTKEVSRSVQQEVTSPESLLADAKEHLNSEQLGQLADLEQKNAVSTESSAKSAALKALSGFWYQFGNQPVAGAYADSVAIIENTDAAWSVAGSTYFNGLLAAGNNELIRTYCANRAVKAFENAISLAPDQAQHRVNLALVYAENPPPNNPMQAVLMLRDLETKYPSEPAVFNALGRLAIKTGQWEKAVERLEKAWSLDKNNPNTPCLLANAYEGLGNVAKAQNFAQLCNEKNK
jgi:Flp pilus assembly protein TadD